MSESETHTTRRERGKTALAQLHPARRGWSLRQKGGRREAREDGGEEREGGERRNGPQADTLLGKAKGS